MSEKQVRDYDKFMLRFPDGMRDAIAARAKANGRSMNSEIVQILEDALSEKAVNGVMLNVGLDEPIALDTADMDSFIKGLLAFAEALKSHNKKPT